VTGDLGFQQISKRYDQMQNSGLTRRKLLYGSLAFAGTSSLLRLQASAASTLLPTPWQTPGPFYPQSFPQDADNDLVHVAGHQGKTQGNITRITGRILDQNGRPVPGARVEMWQCDANGRYHYVQDGRTDQPRDENFQGYVRRTSISPSRVAGSSGSSRRCTWLASRGMRATQC
jgi:protocatechuate 3,4-dioxygenase beta subunit